MLQFLIKKNNNEKMNGTCINSLVKSSIHKIYECENKGLDVILGR